MFSSSADRVDYFGLPATVTFRAGDANTKRRSAAINIADDTLVETTETIDLKATTSVVDTVISPNTATVYIKDNDRGELISVCVHVCGCEEGKWFVSELTQSSMCYRYLV